MLGLARPFPFRFVSSASLQFSGLPLSRPFVVSASLSDPRCFRFLSSASVLGSDYSASVLLFSFLFGSASQWLSRCSFASFVAQVFPLSFRLISHPVCPILLTQLCCLFPFALPCFAPTAASQVLVFFPVSFVPLFLTSVLPCLMLSFVRFRLSGSGYSAFSLFRSASSQTRLAPACLVLLCFFRRSGFHGFLRLVSHPLSFRFCLLGSLPRFFSSFPTSLPQLFRWCLPLFSASFPLLLL